MQSSSLSPDTLMYMFQIISEAKSKTRDLLQQRIFLEVLFIKLATMEELKPLSTVLDKIEGIKKMFEGNAENVSKTVPTYNESVTVPAKKEVKEKPSDGYAEANNKASGDADFVNTWDKVMVEVQAEKKTIWALLSGARVLNIDNKEAVVEFPKNYLIHKERLEKPDEKRIIEGCLEKVTGKKIQVKFTISKNGHKVTNIKSSKHGLVQERKRKEVEDEVKNEPMVKKTIEFFDGSIVNVRGEKE
jgi:DNA polymerase III gamma/tau subunit